MACRLRHRASGFLVILMHLFSWIGHDLQVLGHCAESFRADKQ